MKKYFYLLYGSYFNFLALINKNAAAKKAFELFCTPRKGRVQPQQINFLSAAKDQVLHVDGHEIQTYKWPGGTNTVLLVHGWERIRFVGAI